jgi:hypothetical protein
MEISGCTAVKILESSVDFFLSSNLTS